MIGSLFALGSLQGDAVGDQEAINKQLEAKRIQEKIDENAREQQRVNDALLERKREDQRAADRRLR